MNVSELVDTLVKYALCRSRDERLMTRNVCEQFPHCKGCPYKTENTQANEALELAYTIVTPDRIKWGCE